MELAQTFTHSDAMILGAHNICLRAEQQIKTHLATTTNITQRAILEKKLINIRIVGHLLSVGPTDHARRGVALSTAKCMEKAESQHDYSKVVALGEYFDQHFVRLCESLFNVTSNYKDLFTS